MTNIQFPEFLDHTPVPLAFGTSGLRGLVVDITDLEAFINVKGALRYLIDVGDIRAGSTVVLAGDLRPSTERILRACAAAIRDVGCVVENAGRIPSPAIMLHAFAERRAGVMVTGSHIPFDRNGIKVNKSAGEVLKSDEVGITRAVEIVRAEEYGRSKESSSFNASGELRVCCDLPPLDGSAEERYVRRYLDAFATGGLKGMRVLVYQHSAVGRDLLSRILGGLGAEVVIAGRSDTFIPIDTENITDAELDRLEAFAVAAESEVGSIAAIVSTDGDSDRPLCVAVRPENSGARRVRFLPGDLLGIVVAAELHADAAVVPISANDAVERRMSERGVTLSKCRIGSPFVVAAMDAMRARGNASRIVGWEANGGFLVGSALALKAGTLAALPTRDAVLPLLANLFAAARETGGLDAVWSRLPARFGRAGLLDEVAVATSKKMMAELTPAGAATEVELARDGSVLDRSDSTRAATRLDDATAASWRTCVSNLERFFTPSLGFDEITRVNVLDGVRIHFNNGDVAHLRPSGNAPQLRIYANADSQARADAIVAAGIAEPNGILRQIERSFSNLK